MRQRYGRDVVAEYGAAVARFQAGADQRTEQWLGMAVETIYQSVV